MADLFLSVVVPVYNEEEVLQEFYNRLVKVLTAFGKPHEILFINDGSRDGTLAILKKMASADSSVKIVSFSRNFGHQVAITAGVDRAAGDAVVVIDADLQDPPELIPLLAGKWQSGFDVVYAKRKKRLHETIFKTISAKVFYRAIRMITGIDMPVDVADFRLISRRAVDALKKIRERHRYVRGLVCWIGFKQAEVTYVRDKRYAGKTKYSLPKMVGFSLEGITSFSIMPLRIATFLGFSCAIISFIYVARIFYITVVLQKTVKGWPSLMVVVLLLGGVQLIAIGLLGEYIGRIFDETKDRPLYLIEEEINTGACSE